MLKSQKSELTCSYCSKIFRDPIQLPCGDSICREHLSDKDVVKVNRIKCKKCNGEFGVKNNEFKSHNELNNSIESHSYLSEDEQRLKRELEHSIKQFFEFNDEFQQKRAQLDSNVFDHFQELRFQIDEQREELKKRIDDIALEMIDKIKKSEANYLDGLRERFSSIDQSQSLGIKLNEIEETFRQPNLLIQTVQAIQQKQEESLKDIQFKINQMNQIEGDLKATNEFKPNLFPFKQTEEQTSFVGSLKLHGCWLNVNSFKGQILTDERQITELIYLCEFSPNDKWTLLYRGTRDGFRPRDFHSICDGHSNTLTIVKAKQSSYIFGGYTTIHWGSSDTYKSDSNAFIFSLTNKDNQPLKMKINPNKHKYAINCHSRYGPIFGEDRCIANNAITTMDSYSNLGHSYEHPLYAYGTNEAYTFLAGTEWFQLDEMEVYKKMK
jgi:hypothetical protein